jgi:acetyl-CoA synthetase
MKRYQNAAGVSSVLVVTRTGAEIPWNDKLDVAYEEISKDKDTTCPIEPMQAEDPMFILYTSGSTGKPKGVLHTTAGIFIRRSYEL